MIFSTNFLEYDLTFVLLLFCIALFGYLAFKSRNARSFQFQISIFILIWIMGELANVLIYGGVIYVPYAYDEIGYEIHLGSMIFFSIFLYGRYYYSSKRGHQLIDNVEIEDYHPTKVNSAENHKDSPSEKKS